MSYESPAAHPTITEEERKYIEESIGESAQHTVTVSTYSRFPQIQYDPQYHMTLVQVTTANVENEYCPVIYTSVKGM